MVTLTTELDAQVRAGTSRYEGITMPATELLGRTVENPFRNLPDGRAISQAVRQAISRAGVTMDLLARDSRAYPPGYLKEKRLEQVAAIRTIRDQGAAAMADWAEKAGTSARQALNKSEIGSPAEESRRVANELKLARLVSTANATGNPRTAMQDLTERADRAWLTGDRNEAYVLAQAAMEVFPAQASTAAQIVANIDGDRELEDPTKAKALKSLRDVDVVMAAFNRDTLAETARALQDSVKLANAAGDGDGAIAGQAASAKASIDAKLEAFYGAQQFGDGNYVEPAGTLTGVPTDLDQRGVPMPAGATLPGEGGVA